MINVGQIYSYKKIGNFVITNITEEKISRIWQDGRKLFAVMILKKLTATNMKK